MDQQMAVQAILQYEYKGLKEHPKKPGTVTVAGKLSLDVPPGTLKNILKQASLN